MNNNLEMPISSHLEELRQRLIFVGIIFVILSSISLISIQRIIPLLQMPAHGIKFLQLAPGEYFFVSCKVAIFTSILLSIPCFIVQILLFILPGLNNNEKIFCILIMLGATTLFFIGLLFGYLILIPAALNFFIEYGSNAVEPIWSFEQYFNFILLLLISNGLAFEIPILQILLNTFNLLSAQRMLSWWKYIILLSTIISAILTPSTDPITQLLLALAIIALYFLGLAVIFISNKYLSEIFEKDQAI